MDGQKTKTAKTKMQNAKRKIENDKNDKGKTPSLQIRHFPKKTFTEYLPTSLTHTHTQACRPRLTYSQAKREENKRKKTGVDEAGKEVGGVKETFG